MVLSACFEQAVPEDGAQGSSEYGESGDEQVRDLQLESGAPSNGSDSLLAPSLPEEVGACSTAVADCYWNICTHNNTNGGGVYYWDCACEDTLDDAKPVSGGCSTNSSTAVLIRSNSYENSDHTNMIDDNDCAVGPGNTAPVLSAGWSCVQQVPNNSVTTNAVLCCYFESNF